MKVKKLHLQNFAKFSDIEVVFNDKVTHLVGMNGAGKTTIGLTALQAAIKGIAEKNKDGQLIGERFRFIGPAKKSADVIVTIVDEANGSEIVVKNRITKESNTITFEAPDGYSVSADWLNNLLNVALLSAKNFTQLTSKEQAITLGINVDSIDKEIKDAKGEITIINRDINSMGTLVPVEEVNIVSVSALLAEKKIVDDANREIETKNAEYNRIKSGVEVFKAERDALLAKLTEIEGKISAGEKWLTSKSELPTQSTEEIEKMIESAEKINETASAYKSYKINLEKQSELKETLTLAKQKVDVLQQKRNDIIQGFNFSFDGLMVDEDGGLLLNNRPLKEPYFSKGELEVIVAKLYASLNPTLKVRFIDDFDLIDEDNQAKLVKDLLEADFQIITAEVGKAKEGDNVLILREGAIHKNNSL